MEDNDEWQLGDEGTQTPCPRCGKVNRPGLSHCAICGTALAEPHGVLRTIGESMGRPRPSRNRRPDRGSLRAWLIAAGLLLVIVVGLTWLQSGERPFRLEDLKSSPEPTVVPPLATVVVPPTPNATRVVATATPRPVPTSAPVAAPPVPTAIATIPPPVATAPPPPTPTARPTRTARMTPAPPRSRPTRRAAVPVVVATPEPHEPAYEPAAEATPIPRPAVEATEKPSLGTDLQDATRAYRQAVDVHNARVDEYNALADEVQRSRAWDDSPDSVDLRRRLDRAREAVERARVNAEALRERMESVRARYR
jgi:hypothetical protein